MKVNDSPCFSCPDKGCGNHGNCEKYLAYDASNKARRKATAAEAMLTGYTGAEIYKARMTVRKEKNPYK